MSVYLSSIHRVVVKDVLYPAVSPKYQTYGVAEDVFDINVETDSQYEMCLYNGHDDADDGIMRSYGFAFRLEGLADLDVELGKDTADSKLLEQIEVLFKQFTVSCVFAKLNV
jgi:hypothetical protein